MRQYGNSCVLYWWKRFGSGLKYLTRVVEMGGLDFEIETVGGFQYQGYEDLGGETMAEQRLLVAEHWCDSLEEEETRSEGEEQKVWVVELGETLAWGAGYKVVGKELMSEGEV